ncbi:MAG: phosphoribosylanthranilate isomerase [Rhodospirillales bacterium]|nr:phosphoribosylanthranilate isomerase [Rhodospirillales bacterium]
MVSIKICGIKDNKTLSAAVKNGARFVGFVFYPPSPRAVDPALAAMLIRELPTGVEAVGLFVNPTDQELERAAATGITMIQLHGNESQNRVKDVQKRFNLPVIKALRLADASDLIQASDFEGIADWLLFDTKISGQEGGTGQTFDWTILKDYRSKTPWMLAGGLNARNVNEALTVLSPDAVDVSSGVETTPGQKDAGQIKEFIDAVHKTR